MVEIAIDGLQVSTRYPGGVALRFARVLRYRPDKSAEEADLLETVRALSPVLPDSPGVGDLATARLQPDPRRTGRRCLDDRRRKPRGTRLDNGATCGLPREGGRHRTRARSASERSEDTKRA